MPRVMEITTPLGGEVLLFESMTASEALGRLSEYNINLLSKQNDIDANKLLGKNVTVKMELPSRDARSFDGFVTRFGLVGVHGRYYRYQMVARPWLWFLTRKSNCRIFQNKSVPEIIETIFNEYSTAAFEKKITGTYRTWEYCVQYRETDFNFVSRLMEQEGIYYHFKHTDGKHTVVLADSYSAHAPFPGCEQIPFIAGDRAGRLEQEYVSDWRCTREIQPGAYVIDDFDFKNPSVEQQARVKHNRSHAEGEHEFYDYPGEYVTSAEGEQYVKIRLEELQAQHELAHSTSNARGLATGCLVKLKGHPRQDQNTEYLVVSTTHQLEYTGYETTEQSGAQYSCGFSVLNSKEPFRPQRVTPKPVAQGPQTAIVVGPKGDEIYTDTYGRVKVQFHWDREGKQDENSSCWIRVSHPWAGKNWGMVAIPRIGQEVIVDFLEGDPDRPIIVGRVYNAEQMPPYELPANMTQTGAKSRSSKEGSPANFNEIRFEDKKGEEQVYIHAEKNQDNVVENDETTSVGHDRTETVGNDETITIGVDRTENVGVNETITIGAHRTISVGATETASVALQRTHTVGVNETIAIGAAQEVAIGAFQAVAIGAYQTVNVGANQSIDVGRNRSVDVGGNQSVEVSGNASMSVGKDESRSVSDSRSSSIGKDDSLKVGKNLVVDAGDSVTIKTGSASITMKKDGTIVIKGKDITIQGSSKIIEKATNITSEAAAKSVTKGAMVEVEASGINTIKGSLVKIN